MTQVSASLLAADFARMGDEVLRADQAGVDSFHLDFMDGHYVPNIALAPYHLEALEPLTSLPLQVHLEVANPDQLLSTFDKHSLDMIIVQFDTCPDLENSIKLIQGWGARVGVGLLPRAPITPLLPLLSKLDMLLLLGVQPGFGGQAIDAGMIPWLEEIARRRDQIAPGLPIAIDGGVKANNAEALVEAGADVLIMGTGLFEVEDLTSLVRNLHAISR
jgi:ribulose-phosphate 3-epimerase